jgi:hypothetical protein
MSKVFRRPMFRKGGGVNMNGIMSGIQDREMHAESDPMGVGGQQDLTPSERIKQVYEKYQEPAIDPVAQLLIQGGLRGLSQTGGGGTLANLALAFQEPTGKFFETAQKRKDVQRELELAGVEADISADLQKQEMDQKAEIARLERDLLQAEGDADRQNKIAVELEKRKTKLLEIQEKSKFPDVSKTEQVRPAFENVVSGLSEMYADSKNPAVKLAPDLTAFNVTKFRREATPELISKFKGFKPYTFDRQGNVAELPLTAYQPGDIIYDPKTADFLVFDNQGDTYRLDPLTYEIQER